MKKKILLISLIVISILFLLFLSNKINYCIKFKLDDGSKYTADIKVENNHKVALVKDANRNYVSSQYIKNEDLDDFRYQFYKLETFPEEAEEYSMGKLLDYNDTIDYLDKFGLSMKYTDETSNYCILSYKGNSPVKFELYDYGLRDYETYNTLTLYYYESLEDATEEDSNNYLLVFPTDVSLDTYIELESCFTSDEQMKDDLVIVTPWSSELYPYLDKPVIYLYPEEQEKVNVSVELNNAEFTTVYPDFNVNSSWEVKAFPSGDIKIDDKTYNYLYWEARSFEFIKFKPQYCVKGENTASFLENKLLELGLNEHEANEFIIYWLPQMENNKYNLISFDIEDYCNNVKLNVFPNPDTIIRVYMTWKSSNSYVNLESPVIDTPVREGFTVIEWGGSEIK